MCSPTRNASAVGVDSALLKEIPGEVNIHRTVTLDLPFGFKKSIKRMITRTKPSATGATAATAAPGKQGFLKRLCRIFCFPTRR